MSFLFFIPIFGSFVWFLIAVTLVALDERSVLWQVVASAALFLVSAGLLVYTVT